MAKKRSAKSRQPSKPKRVVVTAPVVRSAAAAKRPTPKNFLYFGDNLDWLRDTKRFPDGFVDLIYLDPPFNSNQDYNVLFKEHSGALSSAQIRAFEDSWHWSI